MTAKRPLYPEQEAGRDWLSARTEAILGDRAGFGKTLQAIEAAKLVGAQRVAVVCPAVARMNWEREAKMWELGLPIVRVTDKGDHTLPSVPGPMLAIVSYDGLAASKVLRGAMNSHPWDVLVLDECFPAGTPVDTPTGPVTIETLNVGDEVFNAVGTGVVTAKQKSVAVALVEVYIEGERFICTPSHPWLTRRGWVRAVDLNPDDEVVTHDTVVRMVQYGVLPDGEGWEVLREVLLSEVEVCNRQTSQVGTRAQSQYISKSESLAQTEPTHSRRSKCPYDKQKPHVIKRSAAESLQHTKGHGARPAGTRGEWHQDDSGRSRTCPRVPRSRFGICSSHCGDAGRESSQPLQNRPGVPQGEIGGGSGWEKSRGIIQKSSRPEERACAGVRRVDSVALQKRSGTGPAGGCEVYNISVSGHPSYSVGGMIVHNCHRLKSPDANRTKAIYGTKVDGLKCLAGKALYRWMLTASITPNSPGELWTHLHALWPQLITEPVSGRVMGYDQFLEKYCFLQYSEYGSKVIGIKDPQGIIEILNTIMLRRTHIEGLPSVVLRDEPLLLEVKDSALAELEKHEDFEDLESVLNSADARANDLEGIEDEFIHLATLRRLTGVLKAKAVAKLVMDELAPDDKIILFALHREVIDTLADAFFSQGVLYSSVHGGVPDGQRNIEIDRFQEHPDCRVFIGQVQACKEAINLTAANRVLLVEQSWCPEDQVQAIARAHRRGQDRQVYVDSVAIAGSIDEVVQRVLARKSSMVYEIMSQHENRG